jgi:hypothetical protein
MMTIEPTHYVLDRNGSAPFVKEAGFFRSQGGLTEEWGKKWVPVIASSIGDARRKAAEMFGVELSPIYAGEV